MGEEIEKVSSSGFLLGLAYRPPKGLSFVGYLRRFSFIPYHGNSRKYTYFSLIFWRWRDCGETVKWHAHSHVADKQQGQGLDSGLMTDALSGAFFYPVAASQVPWRTSKPERVDYNNNSSKINSGSFSICYVLNAILITLYAPFLRLFVISEGSHYYPHLKKPGFREHEQLAHSYTGS